MMFTSASLLESNAILFGSAGIGFLFISLLLFLRGSGWKSVLLFLGAGSFFLHLGAIYLDPFINWWDEQFHALAAKNLGLNFPAPTLISDPALPYDYTNWTANHIWLHKQPLFLWQIGASIQLFGANELGVRFPSVIMATLLSLIVFRMGTLLYSKEAGFIAALLFSVNYFGINLVSGFYHTDHNDFTFLFYVTLSLWSLIEYLKKPSVKWIILIGIFSGCAILTKWLTGLLVFAVWGIIVLSRSDLRKKSSSYIDATKAVFISLLVAAPWQLFILYNYPLESKHELAHARIHFSEVVEGHDGPWNYHFNQLTETIFNIPGGSIFIILLFLLGVFLVRQITERLLLFLPVAIVFLFFSLAKTKMPAFTYCIVPLIFVGTGIVLSRLSEIRHRQLPPKVLTMISFGLITALMVISLKWNLLIEQHTTKNPDFAYRFLRTKDAQIYRELKGAYPAKTIIFNCRPGEGVISEFYSDYVSYDFIPDTLQLNAIKSQGRKIAVFHAGNLPEFILNDPEISIIKKGLWE